MDRYNLQHDQQNIQKPDTCFLNVQTKLIFVTGGVMSGLGKGVTTSSIAKLLQLAGQNSISNDEMTERNRIEGLVDAL